MVQLVVSFLPPFLVFIGNVQLWHSATPKKNDLISMLRYIKHKLLTEICSTVCSHGFLCVCIALGIMWGPNCTLKASWPVDVHAGGWHNHWYQEIFITVNNNISSYFNFAVSVRSGPMIQIKTAACIWSAMAVATGWRWFPANVSCLKH